MRRQQQVEAATHPYEFTPQFSVSLQVSPEKQSSHTHALIVVLQ
jgi:hypothetical protein